MVEICCSALIPGECPALQQVHYFSVFFLTLDWDTNLYFWSKMLENCNSSVYIICFKTPGIYCQWYIAAAGSGKLNQAVLLNARLCQFIISMANFSWGFAAGQSPKKANFSFVVIKLRKITIYPYNVFNRQSVDHSVGQSKKKVQNIETNCSSLLWNWETNTKTIWPESQFAFFHFFNHLRMIFWTHLAVH